MGEETKITIEVQGKALKVKRHFTKEGIDPMSEEAGVIFEKRDAVISGINGEVIFEQKDVEVPKTWSMTATNIVVNKYFRGKPGTKSRESSVRQLISRVADTITAWGAKSKYFSTKACEQSFHDELTHLLVNQKMAFNSPVWFNVGVEAHPQCSACFINSVEDTMDSILSLAKTEGMLFKYGSGTGTNFSTIRGKKESLAGGGEASGPVSFMRGFDSFAGVIKSGGKTRRAAKMVILNVDHPDIEEFISCKVKEEAKAHALIDAGYDAGFNVPGGAYDSVMFQNANHSVRVNDKFMNALEQHTDYTTNSVVDKKPLEKLSADKIWEEIARSAWQCGDPGLQFDDVINQYHTCKNTARINASNPCSEYMFLDDSACNLASINLLKFLNQDGTFDVGGFEHAVALTILAQEIFVDHASYPTKKIEENSHKFRPLGLGYANLGALLMSLGLAYDSDQGRAVAAAITALMGGYAYKTSAVIAHAMKAFAGYNENKDSFLDVMSLHQKGLKRSEFDYLPKNLKPVFQAAKKSWSDVISLGKTYGFKNAQVTVLAPTGTIGFMMDCDTTGIEPDIALVKYKKLVGGGLIKIVNNTASRALDQLGYTQAQKAHILAYIEKNDTIENAPDLKAEHLAVFDCAFKPQNGIRSIQPMAHVKMMAAVQPFLSGAISKTVNMPQESTVEDVEHIHFEAWKRGLKALAIYRDGCKRSQPLSVSIEKNKDNVSGPALPVANFKPLTLEDLIAAAKGMNANDELGQKLGMVKRRRLPVERSALTHKFSIGGHEGYLTVGLFEDGSPGELFCTMAKEGSTISGLMDVFATAISLALQYGVPVKVLVEKFSHTRFEPSGFTKNSEIPMASSVCDYIFRWMGLKFLKSSERPEWLQAAQAELFSDESEKSQEKNPSPYMMQPDAPPCQYCGSIMARNGSCYRCANCGSTSGCS
ncbi:MAG: vitamin B12-dependent ribonucleotide reductase [Myxococcales bacterium]|nr:MAG: vitamin B12-dependent ribonucleotide reductase [Myxococcales bacterium]